MNQRMKIFVFVVCFIVIIPAQVFNQQTNSVKTDPVSLNKYEISCFVSVTGSSPDCIIKLDNNGQILLVCIPGKTIEQLKALNIPFTSSQIRLLKDWRLLRERNKVLKTTFPVLKIDKTMHLRNLMKERAIILGGNLEKDIISLKKELQSIGREKNIYTILFSYILDGLVWDGFKEKHVLSEREITIEKPFWNGVIWASYPPRNFTCGTNSVSDKGVQFNVNWSKVAIKKMLPFVADWGNFEKMFHDFIEKGKVESEDAKKVFGPFNLFDSNGRFTVPIIVEKKEDSLYKISLALSKKICEQVLEVIHSEKFTKDFCFQDKEEALVIAYHELMWELLEYFEQKGLIQKPIAFANPEAAHTKDIADLVFIVKKGQ